MVDSSGVTSTRLVRASVAVALVVAFGLMAGCGGDDDAGGTKETQKGQLEALDKLPKFIQDDFRAGDKNSDGRIQDTELEAMIEEDFKAVDSDGDGEITGAEITEGASKDVDVEASLAGLDLDKDGRVPLEEYAEHVERNFMKQMDTNKDGHLDPPEVATFYEGQFRSEASK